MKEQIIKLHKEGKSVKQIAELMNCSPGTVYWHVSPGTRRSVLANQAKRRKELRKLIKEDIFQGKCCLCGYSKSLYALDFHHKEKEEKEHLISKILNGGEICKLESELSKVILVCKNCHAEIHENMHASLPESPYTNQKLRV